MKKENTDQQAPTVRPPMRFQGVIVPKILHHGTTMQYFDAYVRLGVYEPPLFKGAIWATKDDCIAWPRNMEPGWEHATFVIDSRKAFSALEETAGGNFRFKHLPAGSYKVLRGNDYPRDEHGRVNSGYYNVVFNLERELLEEP